MLAGVVLFPRVCNHIEIRRTAQDAEDGQHDGLCFWWVVGVVRGVDVGQRNQAFVAQNGGAIKPCEAFKPPLGRLGFPEFRMATATTNPLH